jgi:acetate CoA/acetoacetate CoA-transferase alpha subunit
MNKVVTLDEALNHIKSGMTIAVGGFLGCGTPHTIINALVEKGVKDLTLICNDTAYVDFGTGKLIVNKQIKTLYASHIGTNKETGNQMNAGELEVHLNPQGTLAERLRAAGTGLGGFLTPTGVGTPIEEGKEKMEIDGKTYLLEKPLKADVALILGHKVDKKGNIVYRGATRNFSPLMALAADLVIVEAENLVEVGEISPDDVETPGMLVDYIVVGGDK